MIRYETDYRPTAHEYVRFLATSGLGREYPKKDFGTRIAKLLREADVCITARAGDRLVGVCLGLTDFSYFLFLTDLGVSDGYERQGIGTTLVRMAHDAAGGPDDISAITWANANVAPFYELCGFSRVEHAVAKHAANWELFCVE
jgi:N-acetylglutamate synthase-like GNAT family acetyltransferase